MLLQNDDEYQRVKRAFDTNFQYCEHHYNIENNLIEERPPACDFCMNNFPKTTFYRSHESFAFQCPCQRYPHGMIKWRTVHMLREYNEAQSTIRR